MTLVKPKGGDGEMVHHWVEKAVKEFWLTGRSNFPKEKGGLGKSRLSWLLDSISYEKSLVQLPPDLCWATMSHVATVSQTMMRFPHHHWCLRMGHSTQELLSGESGSVGAGRHGGSMLKHEIFRQSLGLWLLPRNWLLDLSWHSKGMNHAWYNKECLSLATWASVTTGMRSHQIPGIAFSEVIPLHRALSMLWKSCKVLQEPWTWQPPYWRTGAAGPV